MAFTNSSAFSLILALIPLLFMQCAQSVDQEGARELRCIKPPQTAPIDLQWMMSVKKWHYILASRYDLYEFASDITNKKPKELSEDEVYYESCISWVIGKDMTFVITGFGGLQRSYKVKLLDESFGTTEFSALDGRGSPGRSYNTLTDNKTFTFTTSCLLERDEMVWAVASPYKSLPKETVKLIHEHALSLGFRREHFTGLRFDSCDEDWEDSQQDKNEL